MKTLYVVHLDEEHRRKFDADFLVAESADLANSLQLHFSTRYGRPRLGLLPDSVEELQLFPIYYATLAEDLTPHFYYNYGHSPCDKLVYPDVVERYEDVLVFGGNDEEVKAMFYQILATCHLAIENELSDLIEEQQQNLDAFRELLRQKNETKT